MLIGLAFRALSRWLQDHAGIQINSEKYTVEHRSASHVVVHMQDVELTKALWSFLLGPAVPFTAQSGLARDVRVDISTETFRIQASGVTMRLRQLEPDEWRADAEAYRASVLKYKGLALAGRMSQTELKRWVKGKLNVSVTSWAVALHADLLPGGRGPCTIVGIGKSVTLRDPTAAADAAPSGEATEAFAATMPTVPHNSAALAGFWQMAKDIELSDLQVFACTGRSLPEAWSAQNSWRPVDRILQPLRVKVAYRNWDFGGLVEFPESAAEARKSIVIWVGKEEAREAGPIVLRMCASLFSALFALMANFDSLYFLYGVVLQGYTMDLMAKPTPEEALKYIELWRQYRAAPAFGRSQAIVDFEQKAQSGFITRMRHFSETASKTAIEAFGHACGSGGGVPIITCPGGPAASPEGEVRRGLSGGLPRGGSSASLGLSPLFELSPRVGSDDVRTSPFLGRRPVAVASASPLSAGASPQPVRDPARRRPSVESCPFPTCGGGSATASSGGFACDADARATPAVEFMLDSAYRIILPSFVLDIDMADLSSCDRACRYPGAAQCGHFRAELPGFVFDYLKNLDAKHMSMQSASCAIDVSSSSSHPPVRALSWQGLSFKSDYYSDNMREMDVRGELVLDVAALWPYLLVLPPLRMCELYPDIFRKWYGQELPEAIRNAADPADVRRRTTYVLDFPRLALEVRPAALARPTAVMPPVTIEAVEFSMTYSHVPCGLADVGIRRFSVLCPQGGLPLPELAPVRFEGVVVKRGVMRAISHEIDDRLRVGAGRIEVNLSPLMLHILRSHIGLYKPRGLFQWFSGELPPAEEEDIEDPVAAAAAAKRREARGKKPDEKKRPGAPPNVPLALIDAPDLEVNLWSGSCKEAAVSATTFASSCDAVDVAAAGRDRLTASLLPGALVAARRPLNPRAQLRLRGMEVAMSSTGAQVAKQLTVSSSATARAPSSAEISLKLASFLGSTRAGAQNDVFACSHINCVPLRPLRAYEDALFLVAELTEDRTELQVKSCSFHLAPTFGFLENIRLLLPGVLPGMCRAQASGAQASPVPATATPRPQTVALGSGGSPLGEHGAAAAPPAASKRNVLKIVSTTIGVHLGHKLEAPTLVWEGTANDDLSATVTGRSAMAILGVASLSVGALPRVGNGRRRTAEVKAERLQVAVSHVDAVSVDNTNVNLSTSALPMWIASMSNGKAAFLFDSEQTSLGGIGSAAICIEDVALWASEMDETLSKDLDQAEEAEVAKLAQLCQFMPDKLHDSRLRRLFARSDADDGGGYAGRQPILRVALNGVSVSGGPPQLDRSGLCGLYAMEHCLQNGFPVYKKLGSELYLTWKLGKQWTIASSVAAADGILASGVVEVDSTVASGVVGGYAFTETEGSTIASVVLAPTLLKPPRISLVPFYRLKESIARLKAELSPPKDDGLPPDAAAALPQGGAKARSWRFLVEATLDFTIPSSSPTPVLRLRSQPCQELSDLPTTSCHMEKVSLELFVDPAPEFWSASTAGFGRTGTTTSDGYSDGPPSLDVLAPVFLSARNILVGRSTLSIGQITGSYDDQESCLSSSKDKPCSPAARLDSNRRRLFVRTFDPDPHVFFSYVKGQCLALCVAPTAVRLHRAWVVPLGALTIATKQWLRASILSAESVVRASHDDRAVPPAAWEGAIWEMRREAAAAFQAPAAAAATRRVLVQLSNDGSLLEKVPLGQGPNGATDRRILGPTGVVKLDQAGVSAMFEYSLQLDLGAKGMLEVALDSAMDFQAFKNTLAQIRDNDMRQQSGSRLSDQSLGRNAAGNSCGDFGRMPTTLSAGSLLRGGAPAVKQVARTGAKVVSNTVSAGLRGARGVGLAGTALGTISPALTSATAGPGMALMSRIPDSPDVHRSPDAGMDIKIAIDGIELWLPSGTSCKDEDRELGILVVADARRSSETNHTFEVSVEKFAAVHSCPACWNPDDFGGAADGNLEVTVRHPNPMEAVVRSFAPLSMWIQSTDFPESGAATPVLPSSPAAMSGMPHMQAGLLAQTGFTDLTEGTPRTAAAVPKTVTPLSKALMENADQLMDTRGLAIVAVWHKRLIGVRLEGIAVLVSVEFLGQWSQYQTHIAAMAEAFADVSPVVINKQRAAAAIKRGRETTLRRLKTSASTSTSASEATAAPIGCGCFPLSSPNKPRRRRESPEARHDAAVAAAAAKLPNETHDSNSWSPGSPRSAHSGGLCAGSDAGPWKMELDVAGRFDLTVSGGLLAPAHKLVARFSDVAVRGPAPPQEGHPPLTAMCKFDVKCYDAQSARMELVIEPVEITVDIATMNNRRIFEVSTARMNLNVHRVLVDFVETARRRLREAGGAPQKPIRRFIVVNETGVPMTVLWVYKDEKKEWNYKEGEGECVAAGAEAHPEQDTLRAALTFNLLHEGPKHEEDGICIDFDHTQLRAYILQESRCLVFVEPDLDRRPGVCRLIVRSAITLHNETAIPLTITLDPSDPSRLGRCAERLWRAVGRGADGRGEPNKLHLGMHSSAHVPLDWFARGRCTTTIKPAIEGIPARSFPQLWQLLEGCSRDIDSVDDARYHPGHYAAAGPTGRVGQTRLGERVKFNLFFQTYLKLIGKVDARDVPMELDGEDSQPTQCFSVHLSNVVTFRNQLPFPIAIQMCAFAGVLERQVLPASAAHEALSKSEGREATAAAKTPVLRCASQDGAVGNMCKEHPDIGHVPCFVVEPGKLDGPSAQVTWTNQLDAIMRLTVGTRSWSRSGTYGRSASSCRIPTSPGATTASALEGGGDGAAGTAADALSCRSEPRPCDAIANYVLGVDEELELPFAKRSLHLSILALPEADSRWRSRETPSGEMTPMSPKAMVYASQGEAIVLAPDHSHKPWAQALMLWPRDESTEAVRKHPWLPDCLQAPSCEQGHHGQPIQVSVEMSRHSVVFYVPMVLENTTPFTFIVDPLDKGCLLEPNCRRVRPHSQQLKDTAYFELHHSNFVSETPSSSSQRGQELEKVSLLSKVHKLHPIHLSTALVPQVAEIDCGLLSDSLSFGLCVRQAEAPLRLSKVISIFPRFTAKNELEATIQLRFRKKDPWTPLHPSKQCPLHPPGEAWRDNRCRIFVRMEADGGRYLDSEDFSIEPKSGDDGERKRTFHLRMGGKHGDVSHMDKFVQVDIQQAIFQAADQVQGIYASDGCFISFRNQDFRGAEDALFHVENCTPHRFHVQFRGKVKNRDRAATFLGPAQMNDTPAADDSEVLPSAIWMHRAHTAYDDCVDFFKDAGCRNALKEVALGTMLTAGQNAVIAEFDLEAKLTVEKVEVLPSGLRVRGRVSYDSDLQGFDVDADLILQCVDDEDNDLCVVKLIEGPDDGGGRDDPKARMRAVFPCGRPEEYWRVLLIDNDAVASEGKWKQQFGNAASAKAEVLLVKCVQLRHSECEDGVHNFKLQLSAGPEMEDESGASKKRSRAGSPKASRGSGRGGSGCGVTEVRLSVPVFSIGWVHHHQELLALRARGMDFELKRHAAGDDEVTFSIHHLQVDHFIDGELPVVLNRRFLHINSRHLGKKALNLSVRWAGKSHIVKDLQVDVVPYWLNLEIGVLIRLWEKADSSFNVPGRRAMEKRRRLKPPVGPCTTAEKVSKAGSQVWRLMNLAIRDLRVTIMLRSPDMSVVRDNPTARWIIRLPTDMPNMDVELAKVELTDKIGSRAELGGMLKTKVIRTVKYSALRSIILSYLATLMKGILSALWWLFRGPFDAVSVAAESPDFPKRSLYRRLTWRVPPLVHGFSEGTYRAMADLLGNSVFFVVLLLNAIRHILIRKTRPRAQSLLDGIVYGFKGLMMDMLLWTWVEQTWLQVRITYQDSGSLWACVTFASWLILLPLGPCLGVLNFAASCCEGLAHILLHEEAQFAPFEPQRLVESEAWSPFIDDMQDAFKSFSGEGRPSANGPDREVGKGNAPRAEGSKMLMMLRAFADDDEVMDAFHRPVQAFLS